MESFNSKTELQNFSVSKLCEIIIIVFSFLFLIRLLKSFFSISKSKAFVLSSKIKISGSLNNALAKANRCNWPPDKSSPLSPTIVSKPFLKPAITCSNSDIFIES